MNQNNKDVGASEDGPGSALYSSAEDGLRGAAAIPRAAEFEPKTRSEQGLCHCMIASLHASRDAEFGGACDCHHCNKECYCA